MKSIIVLYHKDCHDGFGGAWSAWKKFGNKANYIGVEHQSQPPKLKNKEIYLIDFCYSKKEIMEKLLENNKKVAVIDHHISQKETIKISSEYIYNLNHSGSVLAWKYFHPKKTIPKLLLHIEDMDIWKFKLPKTTELMSALEIYDFNFKIWNKIADDFENKKTKEKYIAEGELILKYEQEIIDRLMKTADEANFKGYKTAIVNSPVLHSQIGNAFVKKGYSIAAIWSQKNGKRKISLRSNGKIDVSKIAKEFGGGGHKAAAGFSINTEKPLPWKIVK